MSRDRKVEKGRLYDVFFRESPDFRRGVDDFQFDPMAFQVAGLRGSFPTRYHQLYKGVRVAGGKLDVQRNRESAEVVKVTGNFHAGIDLDVRPKVSADAALRIAAERAGLPPGGADREAELRIERLHAHELERRGEPYALAWRCTLPMDGDRGRHEINVAADDGRILGAMKVTPPPKSSASRVMPPPKSSHAKGAR